MKRVLIISPYFPPTNAADMQRIRMSLPYFEELGWQAEVVTVATEHSDMVKDPLLQASLPANIQVHTVAALSKRWTSKMGFGNIAIRSLPFYKRKVNQLLRTNKYDLIYFSTTQFPVCILGKYWKKKFGVSYVIDMQDPWHTDYYKNKPKHERPRKYWFSYRLNKFLEPMAMKTVDGLIAVSEAYIITLKERYSVIKNIPAATITFGAFVKDFEILETSGNTITPAIQNINCKYAIVYIGRGGHDMKEALTLLFAAFKKGLEELPQLFQQFHLYFIGTSYAPAGEGVKTIMPIAADYDLQAYVTEQTDRIPFYQGLKTLKMAAGFVIPGSNDAGYTASKLYPYILAQKPLLGIFHEESSAVKIIKNCNAGQALTLQTAPECFYMKWKEFLSCIHSNNYKLQTDWKAFEPYTAKEMCRQQVALFDKVLKGQQ